MSVPHANVFGGSKFIIRDPCMYSTMWNDTLNWMKEKKKNRNNNNETKHIINSSLYCAVSSPLFVVGTIFFFFFYHDRPSVVLSRFDNSMWSFSLNGFLRVFRSLFHMLIAVFLFVFVSALNKMYICGRQSTLSTAFCTENIILYFFLSFCFVLFFD